MRDNLIFCGIEEDRHEDCEEKLRDFLQRKLRIDYSVSFERVHRLGKYREYAEKPRNIVAKFSFFKDREHVRRLAPRRLKGSRYWINEQYPAEIEERRKKLYPVMRQARADNRRVKLVRDVLYIDGDVYTPENRETQPEQTRRSTHQSANPGSASSNRPSEVKQSAKRARQSSTPDRDRD